MLCYRALDEVAMKTDFPPTTGEALASGRIDPDAGRPDETTWSRLRTEAAQELMSEPALAPLYEGILASGSFEDALARSLVKRLSHPSVPAEELKNMLLEPLLTDGSVAEAARADLSAVVERDPASDRLLEPFLFFKGYAAIQTHRLTHWLWNAGKRDIALYLQSRSSEIFQTDIHPGAQIGKGVFLDHATGFVAGETVVIEDNVSILHGVTLGGTGTEKIDRHPKIRTGVLIGAGAQIIGNIEIGAYSRIAAGSFVTQPVPPRCTAVGVPARILKGAGTDNPAQTMDETLAQGTYESFTYVI
jgi:serine O-acetyltransferase